MFMTDMKADIRAAAASKKGTRLASTRRHVRVTSGVISVSVSALVSARMSAAGPHAATVSSASTCVPFMRTDTTDETPGSCIVTP